MNHSRLFILAWIFVVVILPFSLPAAGRDTVLVTPQEITMAEFFYPDNAVSHIFHGVTSLEWLDNETFFYTDRGRESTGYILMNAKKTMMEKSLAGNCRRKMVIIHR